MVFESTTVFPTPEGAERTSPPPISTYGFQKLASEYFAQGAWEQYELPYTILRPFNCVGIGERRAVRDTDVMSGNVKLALSPRRAGPRAQGAQGPGPAPHPRRRATRSATTRTAATSRTASGSRWSRRPRSTRTSTSRPRRPRPCSSSPRRSGTRSTTAATPFRYVTRPALRARRPAARARRPQGARRPRLRGDDVARSQMLDEVIPWIRDGAGGRPAVTDAGRARRRRALDRRARLQGGRGGRARPAGADRRDLRARTRSSSSTTSTRTRRSRSSSASQAELPAIRGLRNDLGRGVLNAMKAGIAASTRRLRADLDGGRLGRAARRRSDGRAGAGGADVVSRVALHARRTPGRWPAAQAADEPDGGPDAPLVRRRRDPRPDQQLQALLAPLPGRDDHRERRGLRARARAHGQGDPRSGRRVAEVPTTWRDRTAGQSNFKLRKWLPHYLHWYWVAFRGGSAARG